MAYHYTHRGVCYYTAIQNRKAGMIRLTATLTEVFVIIQLYKIERLA